MLPKRMNEFLHDLLPERVWQNRRKEENSLVFMKLTSQDVELSYCHNTGTDVCLGCFSPTQGIKRIVAVEKSCS